MKNPLLRLMKRLKPFKWNYALVCAMGIALAALDMIPPRLVGNAVTLITGGTFSMATVIRLLLLWACVALGAQALHGLQIAFASYNGEKVLARMREDLFDHLQRLSVRFFDRTPMGRILNAFGSDLDSLYGLAVWGFNTVTSNASFLIFSAIMIWRTDANMFFAVAWLAPLMSVINFIYGRKISESWQNLRRDSARVASNQAENIAGYRVVAAFNRQEENLTRFNELQDINALNSLRVGKQNGLFQPALQGLRFFGQAIILLYGGYRVATGRMVAGDLVSVSLYWEWFMMPSINFGGFFNDLIISSTGAERVLAILDVKPEVEDEPDAVDLPPIAGRVTAESVSFSYEPGVPVLSDVSFEIEAGSTVALVGETGSGKTTLLSLLARFFHPQSGRILLDGFDIRKATAHSLHEQMALVLQSNFLFQGTVRSNLRYDRPLISDAEIELAMRALGCHERFLALPKGYDTEVGEGGSALSLGERQLVCFARALLRNPRLLLLDEATSALDPLSDFQVRQSLRKLTRHRTTFIVTHRLRTAIEADSVLMMEGGRIVEQGSHDELLRRGGTYAKLFSSSLRATSEFEEPFFDVPPEGTQPASEPEPRPRIDGEPGLLADESD